MEFLKTFILDNAILWDIIVFSIMLITNIFPVMIFILPDIAIFLWIFIANKVSVWYVPYILLIIWAFLWELISYFMWYKYWKKILQHKLLKKDIVDTWVRKLKQHRIKTLIIWKLIPWVMWFMPVLSWTIKINPILFSIINFIMIIYSISLMFFIWTTWLELLENYVWEYIWYLLFTILLIYIVYHIYSIKKK